MKAGSHHHIVEQLSSYDKHGRHRNNFDRPLGFEEFLQLSKGSFEPGVNEDWTFQ